MIEFTPSAEKHGISAGDALYAIKHAIVTTDQVEASDTTEYPRQLFIGPQHAQTDRLIEVIIERRPSGKFVVFHVMPLGPKYRHLIE